ncbi:hypothetical protein [Pseudodesulfovibrio sp.]|uniref:VgrG-related protein n=1 Tax=Pseudodesulfovibrio sp. TaxID=2035812 RepID=UPI002635A5D8|nr:hypothetical protein [Pseudodesulfovibrio sp.]MDD3311212.1 hypothetical protein [Pseudodesulfovibrio sp.]
MFDFGKSLINMDPDEQKKMLDNATGGQRRAALEMGIGYNNQNQQPQRQQKRDAYHDLDRLNFTVEKENEAHDFFGKGLGDWQKNVTGNQPSKDATNLKKQFDDYEHSVLSTVPKGGKRHEALSKSLPDIKKGFLQQGHQFALDKLNERSRNVLDKGLQRLAKGALGAKDEKGVQAHDDAAFDLINKYVLSEAKFDEKDADAMYDKYLGYAGVDVKKARASEGEDVPGAKPGFKMEDTEMLAANDTGSASDAGGNEEAEDAELQIPEDQDEVHDGNQYRGKVKDQEQQKESPKPQGETPNTHAGLGELSEKYESGRDGSHAISSGEGDLGGKSYGKYQMTSRHKGEVGGRVKEFVTSKDFPWKDEFEGLTPGSVEFDKKWRDMADKYPEEFERQQDKFIYDGHYLPVANGVKEFGLDADKHSKTLQQVLWSTGVQHGPDTNVVKKAVEKLKQEERFDPSSQEFESDLIEAIYEERKTRFGGSSKKVRESVQKRLEREKLDALNKLKKGRKE